VDANRVRKRDETYDSGFVARQNMEIEFENNKEAIATLTRILTTSPVQFKFRFLFTLSDKKREEARNEVIKLSIEDAKQKAKLIARSLGHQLGQLMDSKYGTFQKDYFLDDFDDPILRSPVSFDITSGLSDSMSFDVKQITMTDQVILKFRLR
jgi:hypothetical protein